MTSKTKVEDLKIGDVTDDGWVVNATYKTRPEGYTEATAKLESLLEFGTTTRNTVHIYGDHGIGKTSGIKAWFAQRGIEVVYINLANITPDDKIVVAPVRGPDGELALKQLLMDDMTSDVPYAIVLDDARQANQKVQNQFMQLTNDWSLGHHKLKNLVSVVMLDNEGEREGIRTSEDLAVADRKTTIRIGANDTGWRYALAAKYQDVDLRGVFNRWDTLPVSVKHTLSPRALDHVLYCVLNGFPPIYGLPIIGDARARLQYETEDGFKDITVDVLRGICTDVGRSYYETVENVTEKVVKAALRDNLSVLIQGPPGVGKTAMVKEAIRDAGYKENYYSMPFTDPETLTIPMPTAEGTLKSLVASELIHQDDYAIIWDEYNRPASPASFAKLMEITQEWSLAGIPLEGCKAQIALCNPSEWQGRKMAVTRGNIAQADRFTISVQINQSDIPATQWLSRQWPNTVAEGDAERYERAKWTIDTVLEWYHSDLHEEHRQWVSMRNVQRFAELALMGMPVEWGKIYLGDNEYAPVPMVDLEARLAARAVTNLQEILQNPEQWLSRLAAANEEGDVGSNDTDLVHQALAKADVSRLEKHRELVKKLWLGLPPKLRMTFYVTDTAETKAWWLVLVSEISAERNAEAAIKQQKEQTVEVGATAQPASDALW